MFHVLGCITQQHDLRLVALAVTLCLFASATAMSLMTRAQAARGKTRTLWIASAGIVAGCGIWATHFVAMLAFHAGIPVGYDAGLTILSIVVAVLLCGAGFAMALNRSSPWLGGALVGVAIGAMHYIGMAAIRAPAVALWNWHYVAASTTIGIVAMMAGVTLAVRGTEWPSRLSAVLAFTLAICGMHFTGMSAVAFRPDPTIVVPGTVVEPVTLAIAVAAVAFLIVALGLVGSLVDRHLAKLHLAEAKRLRAYVTELESTKTRLEQTSEHLTRALEAAAAANHAKASFLSSMSHELRTPLNAIIGFSEVLLKEAFGPVGSVRYKEYADHIHTSGAHLLALINDILDLARIDAGENKLREEVLGLSEVIDEALSMIAAQAATAQVSVMKDVDPAVRFIYADERRLKQILLNLLGNAVKFTRAGGWVNIRAFRNELGLIITVSDTGIGMAKDDIPIALERFGQIDSTLARQYQGTGLGLPLARDLVELHGGSLTVDSKPDIGTTVTVTLPAGRIVKLGATATAAA